MINPDKHRVETAANVNLSRFFPMVPDLPHSGDSNAVRRLDKQRFGTATHPIPAPWYRTAPSPRAGGIGQTGILAHFGELA
jgi:hypothetical protein